jgi:hypothetical protein
MSNLRTPLETLIRRTILVARCFVPGVPDWANTVPEMAGLIACLPVRTDEQEKALAVLLHCMREVCQGSYDSSDGGLTAAAWRMDYHTMLRIKCVHTNWTAKL